MPRLVGVGEGGVVDENRHRAKLLFNRLHHALHRRGIGDVSRNGNCGPAILCNRRGERLGLILAAVEVDHHAVSGAGQGSADGGADAARAAGDEGDAVVSGHCVLIAFLVECHVVLPGVAGSTRQLRR
jgi:hypothetical protein